MIQCVDAVLAHFSDQRDAGDEDACDEGKGSLADPSNAPEMKAYHDFFHSKWSVWPARIFPSNPARV